MNMSGAKMSARLPTVVPRRGSILGLPRVFAGRPPVRCLLLEPPLVGLVDLDLVAFLVDVDVLVVVAALLGSAAALLAGGTEQA